MGTDNLIKITMIPIVLALFVVGLVPFYASIGVNYLGEESLNNTLISSVIEQGDQTINFAEDVKDEVTVVSAAQEETGTLGFIRDLFSSFVGSVIQSARIVFNSLSIFGVLFTEGVGALQLQGNFNAFLIATGTTFILLLLLGVWLKWVFKI